MAKKTKNEADLDALRIWFISIDPGMWIPMTLADVDLEEVVRDAIPRHPNMIFFFATAREIFGEVLDA